MSLDVSILLASSLVVASALVSRLSSAYGIPSLLLFLGLGMLAGSDGIGKIPFEDHSFAYGIGSIALALILFDGGIRTSLKKIRPMLFTGISLSINGTLLTALLTGFFARFALSLNWQEAFLLGAIVSSTDAAAVFSMLRSSGTALPNRLRTLLEFEAGSNDPVSAFLTIAVLTFLRNTDADSSTLIVLFLKQFAIGTVIGVSAPYLIRQVMNRAGVEFEGLYGVLAVGLGLMTFSLTNELGGSGFLAIYLTGLFLSDQDFLHKNLSLRFLDTVAWGSQIVIFLVLGLLVFPSELFQYWREGLLVALFLAFIARPISVFIALMGSSFHLRDRSLSAWIGLRGAAPIILSTLPIALGIESGGVIFNIVFFVVLISVLIQGLTLPHLMRWFGSAENQSMATATPLSAEVGVAIRASAELKSQFRSSVDQLGSSAQAQSRLVSFEYTVQPLAQAQGLRVVDLGLPPGVLLTSIQRNGDILIPQGETTLFEMDKVSGFTQSEHESVVTALFTNKKA